VSIDLVERARSGDQAAFEELAGRYRGEVRIHCYRFLGSLADADDALQETLTAAWRGLAGFEGRASFRTWLYRIATNRCLNLLRAAGRRAGAELPVRGADVPEPTRRGEVVWLEPCPDVLLDGLPDPAAGPAARYETRESISLAFITALQLLPPRQRAALLLCDVLDFPARQAADMLGTTPQSVASALKRARVTLAREAPTPDRPPPVANSPAEQQLLSRLVRAFEASDVPAVVALLTDDAWVRMPPVPLEYQGRDQAARFFGAIAFRRGRRYRLVPTRANGQPAFGVYLRDPVTGVPHAFGLFVVTLAGERVSAITRFGHEVFARFGLPRTLAE
jgi:RNA polymerase sigma-70 factor (ECF subfamily)